MLNFDFDPEKHEYSRGGVVIPSVTQILQGVGLVQYDGIDPWILQHKAAIGKAVDLACTYYDQGVLDTVPDLYAGYVEAWKKFTKDTRIEIEFIRYQKLAELDGMYYGMEADRGGTINGQRYVIDIKTTVKEEVSWRYQLAAYEIGLGGVWTRMAVQLREDGTYRTYTYKDKRDAAVFRAALLLTYAKIQGGLKWK